MYGYVVVNKPELKFKEYDVYKSYYCGLCHKLKEQHGNMSRLSLSYDATFVLMLLNGLYEPDITYEKSRCVVHPFSKHEVRTSVMTDYMADMNLMLSYYKCEDDWVDEKKITKKAYSKIIEGRVKAVEKLYPDKAKIIRSNLHELSELEKKSETNIDKVSECFGNVLSAIMSYKDDEWSEELKRIGFFLGKYIYILDAYDDLLGDIEHKRYNVLVSHMHMNDFEGFIRDVLENLMANCVRSFERLPVIENVEILRNILYAGVWTRFEAVNAKGTNKKERE